MADVPAAVELLRMLCDEWVEGLETARFGGRNPIPLLRLDTDAQKNEFLRPFLQVVHKGVPKETTYAEAKEELRCVQVDNDHKGRLHTFEEVYLDEDTWKGATLNTNEFDVLCVKVYWYRLHWFETSTLKKIHDRYPRIPAIFRSKASARAITGRMQTELFDFLIKVCYTPLVI